MKIGILTFHRPANFGANLQAFSSYRYLTSLGHNVKVIDFVRDVDDNYSKTVCKEQVQAHVDFVNINLSLTSEVRTPKDLQDIVYLEKFDIIIIGADAVWRKSDNCVFFADWLFSDNRIKDIPVASLSAAHMGNGFSMMSPLELNYIKGCLEKFNYISVRDSWTQYVVNRDVFAGNQVLNIINPDPVFLLDEFVEQNWESNGLIPQKYILLSLPQNWTMGKSGYVHKLWFNKFKKFFNKKGYAVVELPVPEGKSGLEFDYSVNYPIDPIQWYLYIKNAYAFCGLRFHAIVSCISAGTPFFSIDTYGNVSKLKWLLTLMGFYKLALKGDSKSKINNLLKGSGFEEHRVDVYIENIPPRYIYDKIEGISREDILRFRNSNISSFKKNVSDLLKSI